MSFHPSPSKPRLKLPPGACDTHFHVFGPQSRFPFAQDRSYTPAGDAPKETLFGLHKHLGIARGVVVQSAAHGFDNSAAADLIASRKRDYVGVAMVSTNLSTAELKRLDAQGFRGARFHFTRHLGTTAPIDDVLKFAARIADIGWHLQIHYMGDLLDELAPALARSPVPVVIDHMGRIDASLGLEQKPFNGLLTFLKSNHVWVKVSGSERISKQPAPWKDAWPFARKLVAEFGDRVLWGTDWPHPNLKAVPDDGVMVDIIAEMAPSEAERRALLVDNPRRFYRI
ncbi:MAG TPA: amidohydrolase family protein [Burkholderiales bacterium]|nr:amidohydrolase family protein [Burkholderiales bacterium]